MREEAPDPADVISWEERRLCPDGGCVGVVGADGACNTCGRIDPEAARRIDERGERGAREEGAEVAGASPSASGAREEGRRGEDAGDGGEERAAGGERGEAEGDEWQQRKLCEDGACIGVVIDGRCNTCGKAQ